MVRAFVVFATIVVAIPALVGCRPAAVEENGKGKKSDDDDDGDDDGSAKKKKHPVPPPRPIEADRQIRALEAEVQNLKQQIADGKPQQTFPGLINAHEHLYKMADLERYLPAARAAGITATVVVSSSNFTLSGAGTDKGEPGMSKNFDTVLEAAKKYPGEIIPFCTMDPHDPDKLERLKKHVEEGCKGLKLYSGHSNFYDGPLEGNDMGPVLDYLEQTQLPVLWHIHLGKYLKEFEQLIEHHPNMNILVPHYGVTFWKPGSDQLDRLSAVMRKHKNVIVDTSLGTREILIDGMAVMEPHVEKFQNFFNEFQDQIVWGTDSVITGNPEKTTMWFSKVIHATRDHLEKDTFTTDLAAAYSKYHEKGRDADGRYMGLHLPPDILKKVYVDNARRWLRLDSAKK